MHWLCFANRTVSVGSPWTLSLHLPGRDFSPGSPLMHACNSRFTTRYSDGLVAPLVPISFHVACLASIAVSHKLARIFTSTKLHASVPNRVPRRFNHLPPFQIHPRAYSVLSYISTPISYMAVISHRCTLEHKTNFSHFPAPKVSPNAGLIGCHAKQWIQVVAHRFPVSISHPLSKMQLEDERKGAARGRKKTKPEKDLLFSRQSIGAFFFLFSPVILQAPALPRVPKITRKSPAAHLLRPSFGHPHHCQSRPSRGHHPP